MSPSCISQAQALSVLEVGLSLLAFNVKMGNLPGMAIFLMSEKGKYKEFTKDNLTL